MTHLRLLAGILSIAAFVVSPARSEKLVLFSAKDAGADAWSWSAARAKPSEGGIKITEKNPEADYGDVFLTDRFPYFSNGEINLDVEQTDGSYTLQVLAFKEGQYLKSVEITKDSSVTGPQRFSLREVQVPEETETITFKIWIGGEAASMKLSDLQYAVSIDKDALVFDQVIGAGTTGKTDGVTWSPAVNGGLIRLEADRNNGSVLFQNRVPVFGSQLIILDAPLVKEGTVTVQLPVFDSMGTYLDSVNTIIKTGPGLSSARLDTLEWPAHADSFEIKVWLGGTPNAKAQIRRIMVLKKMD